MIGTYDDISHRLSELFHIRAMKSFLAADPPTQTIDDTGGLISPQVGDLDTAITTMAHDRPVTLLWFAEHDDDIGYQNFVYTDPYSGERTLNISKAVNHDHNFVLYDADVGTIQTSVPHGHATVDLLFRNKHWDVVSMRNFPERTTPTANWIFNVRTVNTDWSRSDQTYGETNSISIDSTTNGMTSTTRFRFYESYFWQYATASTPYQTQGLRGPVICFDRALTDAELHEFCCAPYEILRRHWSDVLFAVSPLTGEDFSLRRNHWQARYSTSTVTAEIESSEPVGLIPGIDHSSARVSGRSKSFFNFVETIVTGDANLATSTATAFQPAAAGIATGDANLASSTATAFQPSVIEFPATGDANLATSTVTAFTCTTTGGVSIAVILNDAVTIPLTIPDSVTIPMTVRDSVILPSEV